MKKQLLKNTLVAIAALFIAIIALPTTAQAQELQILGKDYYEDAVENIGGGTATWDKANATLTLDGINVESFDGIFIYCDHIPNLKIVLVGNNTVNCTSYILLFGEGNVEISGTGSLTARATDQFAIMQNTSSPGTLTIKDCMLDVQGDQYSIVGYENGPNTAALSLVVDNATLKVKGATGDDWKTPGIYGLKAYELRGCHIETPGVRFGKIYEGSGRCHRHLSTCHLCRCPRQRHLLPRRQPTATDAAGREHRQDERRDNTQGHKPITLPIGRGASHPPDTVLPFTGEADRASNSNVPHPNKSNMNQKLSLPLIPPLSGRWARAGLMLLLSTTAVGLHAQDNATTPLPLEGKGKPFWSIYAEGGLSWATDVWYQNLDAKRSYKQSPAVGGGVDFTIRPWVRVGAEYLWSRYRREQRFSTLDTKTMPVKTYGNYLMNFHNAKLGAGFNLMELWPRRRAQWLNIWAGTGVGYTFAKGNEYGIYFSNTKTQDGQTTPLTDGASISNDGAITITGNVQTKNRHEKFNTLYIPASLHIEADVSRRFTIGLKGEMDWLLNRKDIAPKNLVFALATVRYNFVPSRARAQRACYEGAIATLNDRVNALQREASEAKAQADKAESARRQAEQQNADLQRRLQDCENSKPTAATAFARSVRGKKLSLMAEASTPGSNGYNQQLSERRLRRVVEVLVKEGFALEDLHPTTAIGEQQGKPSAEGRRVTITSLP